MHACNLTIEPREMFRHERSLADEFGEAITHPLEVERWRIGRQAFGVGWLWRTRIFGPLWVVIVSACALLSSCATPHPAAASPGATFS